VQIFFNGPQAPYDIRTFHQVDGVSYRYVVIHGLHPAKMGNIIFFRQLEGRVNGPYPYSDSSIYGSSAPCTCTGRKDDRWGSYTEAIAPQMMIWFLSTERMAAQRDIIIATGGHSFFLRDHGESGCILQKPQWAN